MSTPFSRSMRSLAADGFRRSMVGLFIAAALLISWVAWFCLGQVTLYEVTTTARLEVERAIYPVEAPVAGRIVGTRLALGREVQSGDVLVELETNEQRLQLAEERARLSTLTAQIDRLRDEIMAEEEAQRQEHQAAREALDEARARYREAQVATQSVRKEAAISLWMQERQLTSRLEATRATMEVPKRQAAAEALRIAIRRLEGEQRTKESDRRVRLQRLKREAAQLAGQRVTAAAASERPAYEITRRSIRAPVAGRLGEVANVQVGTMVPVGEKLGAVVTPGALKVMADFPPARALGRIQPGQPAQLRLEGFPWTQYGSVAAQVTNVASEIREKMVRVELAVRTDAASAIPFQHGLPATVTVEVEHVSPAMLVLRTAGRLLSTPDTAPGRHDDRRAER